ncbi:transketolase [Shumkonia mesophila]|uniref:transketolase n=1 Tax=Shumkonia mesophila TaxID=2838854 RepID=UPI002934AED6|nr:transketolase [Shumkonia mesophila]
MRQDQDGSSRPDTKAMANALRFLAMDAVEKAQSGHPGMPMGMANVATVLFGRFLKFDPTCPTWPDRDRFVLSGGHGSMLLYALLHLTGYRRMPMEAIRAFRQLGSIAAGHPEVDPQVGIETTTGPLGQGFATAVGMALAERLLNARFGYALVDHRTWVMCGDGDLMEGISHEAASLAGHLRLERLTVLYDDNGISIDGPTALSFSEDVLARFQSYGWNVAWVDGHDHAALAEAMQASLTAEAPTLVACGTTIGFGAPNKAGKSAAHGAPLGADEIAATREALGWPYPPFEIPSEIRQAWAAAGRRGAARREAWQASHDACPEECRVAFDRRISGALDGLGALIQEIKSEATAARPAFATRSASGKVLDRLAPVLEALVGGSADLTPSNNTRFTGAVDIAPGNFAGRYVRYGVRENAMASIMNGLALHGGFIPYGGTFLCFADYARPGLRLAALMRQRVIHVMTHDSIGLGEDGPTHQPVEHLASLRAIPGLLVLRPADLVETAECWEIALKTKDAPSVLSLSRQALPTIRSEGTTENRCARGGYVLAEAGAGPRRVTLIASGSEVVIALDAREALERKGIGTAVISMPCMGLFGRQPDDYRRAVLQTGTLLVGIEAAVRFGWGDLIGEDGVFIGMSGFGASGPGEDLYRHFGITAEAIVGAVRERLGRG